MPSVSEMESPVRGSVATLSRAQETTTRSPICGFVAPENVMASVVPLVLLLADPSDCTRNMPRGIGVKKSVRPSTRDGLAAVERLGA